MKDGWISAEALIENFCGTASYLGGAIRACEENGVGMIPLDSTTINGGPMMTAGCLEQCMGHLCRQVEEKLP